MSFLHFHFELAESRSDYHLVTITLTCVHRKNTIQRAANQCSSYVTPLYYIAKWYLHSILSQKSCPKIFNSIAHGYNFIEINLGKHDLTKLANNKATKKLNHPQCVVSSSSPHMDPIHSFKFTTNNRDNLLPTRSQSSIATLQTNFHDYRNQWESASTWASASMRTMAQPHESMQWDYHFSKEKLPYKLNWTTRSTYQQAQPRHSEQKEKINSPRWASCIHILSSLRKEWNQHLVTLFGIILLQQNFAP